MNSNFETGRASTVMSDEVPVPPQALGKYLSLHTSSSAAFLSQNLLSFENRRTALTPGPFQRAELVEWKYGLSATGSGFPEDLGDPVLKFKKNDALPLRDFEGIGSLILLSAKALRVLKDCAAPSLDCRNATVYLCDSGGENKVDGYTLCDVTRFEDLLDIKNSALDKSSVPNIYWEAGSRVAFLDRPSGDVHLFRLLNMPDSIFCSRDLAHAAAQAGLTGAEFVDPGV